MVTHSNSVWFGLVMGLVAVIAVLTFVLPSPRDFTPPSVGITYPNEGASVTGIVDIGVYATDASGIARVDVSLGCQHALAVLTHEPYTITWDTTTLTVRRYELCVTAWDRAGLSSRVTREVSVVR